ncbi:alpha-mannosidase [Termitidicoccus mucosus]|uniref:Alpha-mannosidase n=1 Tax=Termitidicoccus mucosus TaxID=1184151 RepID=A0A178IGJ7_9BACT|nr:alpha-mannosidase [Opitutaceae bacterium TSB47]
MLPRTFLTQLIPARVAEAARRLQARIWQPLPDEAARIEIAQTRSFPEPGFRVPGQLAGVDFSPVVLNDAGEFHWGPKYAQRWFRLALPAAPDGDKRTRYLEWRDQAEATLYVNVEPWSGLDVAHKYCPLPAGAREALVEAVCIRSAIWLAGEASPLDERGSRFAPPRLFARDDLAWDAWNDLKVLLDVLEAEHRDFQPPAPVGPTPKVFTDPVRFTPPVLRASPLFRRWCRLLDRAVDALDRDGSEAFSAELKKIMRDFPAAPDALRAVLTGHAHIDLVWLWPERVGEFKAIHTWATQARLLREYPEFRFGYSQPASYEAVRRHAPALHERVRGLIAAGRWEATGAGYVECDTQLPCGEALLRGLRIGQREFAALRGGGRARVFWLPDVFGYSGCMPQLLRGCGVEGFFTTKLSWSTVNRFPHTSFRWRGADGSEVAAHIVLLHDYNEAVDIRRLREDALHHQQAAVHPEFLVPTGYGDGGGGPTEEMLERARRVRSLAGVPRVEWGGIEAFFDRLGAVRDELPAVTGELLLELHRGVFTTHGRLKAAFRALERALQIQEAAHAATGAGPVGAHAWKRLVFSQFHDHIPGSSIWEVYARAIPELEQLAADALGGAAEVLSSGKMEGRPPCRPPANADDTEVAPPEIHESARGWFNPLAVTRTWTDGGRCYELPPLSGAPAGQLKTVEANAPRGGVDFLENERVRAEFEADSLLTRLMVDGREVALDAGTGRLVAYPDHPADFAAWDVDRTALVAGQEARPDGAPVVAVDGLTASVSFPWRVGAKSRVIARYSLTAHEPVLRVDYDIDWHDPLMWMKAIFATRYAGRDARFGAPFGSVLRGQWPGYAREEANWELPMSRWLTVLDDAHAEGLSIVSEAKYGVSVREGVAGVSLLRSAFVTEADHHPQIRETPGRPVHSDLGRHCARLALTHFSADGAPDTQPALLADTLFTPCVPHEGPAASAGLRSVDGAPSLVPAWAEPVRDGWILRLHETQGRGGTAFVRPAPGWSAMPATMDGEPEESAARATDADGGLRVPFTQYQVRSVRLARTG